MPICIDSARAGLPRVLVLDAIHADGIARLRDVAAVDVVEGPGLTEEELEACIGNYHALINRSRTPIPDTAIRQGKNLRIIVRAGVGLDNIDVAAAEEVGIQVANCPDATTLAVAEHTLALMLAAADASMKAGRWEKAAFKGAGLAGKTLGIVGFGRIGRAVAQRAKAFDMRVLVNQTRQTPELAQEWSVDLIAASTEDAQRRAALDAADQIVAALKRTRAADTLALRVAPVAAVTPHEGHHPRRVDRLAQRIAADGVLVNPPTDRHRWLLVIIW